MALLFLLIQGNNLKFVLYFIYETVYVLVLFFLCVISQILNQNIKSLPQNFLFFVPFNATMLLMHQ